MQKHHAPTAAGSSSATMSGIKELQTCVLKVSIHCAGCKNKVRKLLQRIEGVSTIHIDSDQGKVTVTGTTDPATLITRLAKNGKHAELLPAAPNSTTACAAVNNNAKERDEVATETRRLDQARGDGGGGRGGKGPRTEHRDGNKDRHHDVHRTVKNMDRQSTKGAAFGMTQLRSFILPLITTRDQRYVKLGKPGAVHDHEDGTCCDHWSDDAVYSRSDASLTQRDGMGDENSNGGGNAPSGGRNLANLAIDATPTRRREGDCGRSPSIHGRHLGTPLIDIEDPVCEQASGTPAESLPSSKPKTSLAALFQDRNCADDTPAVENLGPVVHGTTTASIDVTPLPMNAKRPPPPVALPSYRVPMAPVNHYTDGRFMSGGRQKETTTVMQQPIPAPSRADCMPPSAPNHAVCLL